MKEVNSFKDNQELLDFFDGITLKFNFLSDGVAHYKTTIPKFIQGNFVDVSASFYHDDGQCLQDYDLFEDLSNFNQLSEVSYYTPEHENIILYFSKYKEVSIP
jgi:hypothetical protein